MGDSAKEIDNISQSPREPPREPAVRELAGRQHGHATRGQLLEIGLGSGAITARVKSGSLVTRYPGVYAVAPARVDPPALAFAAVLACGPDAVLSHFSAAYLWGFVPRWQAPPEVTLATGDRRPRGIVTHRCRSLKRGDMRRQQGVPTTSPARTILDLAPRLSRRQLTRMVNDARLEGHLKLGALQDVLERNPHHHGSKLLRRFVEHPTNPTRSWFEDVFPAFAERYGLPEYELNARINGREVDVLFRKQGVIVELDSRSYHMDEHAFEDDRERDAENLKHGLVTVRITKERFERATDYEGARLQEILQGREGVLGSSYGLLPEL